ncbi:unnamed protein product [marine sediment metagenome]|uniref:Uncharacterized protein n=1 Tax=marine sediment metagenome TaxID=412755 RepID=X1FJH9_9ZZZZ
MKAKVMFFWLHVVWLCVVILMFALNLAEGDDFMTFFWMILIMYWTSLSTSRYWDCYIKIAKD